MKIVETRKQFKALQDNLNVHPFVVTDETVADGLAASVWTIQGIAGHFISEEYRESLSKVRQSFVTRACDR